MIKCPKEFAYVPPDFLVDFSFGPTINDDLDPSLFHQPPEGLLNPQLEWQVFKVVPPISWSCRDQSRVSIQPDGEVRFNQSLIKLLGPFQVKAPAGNGICPARSHIPINYHRGAWLQVGYELLPRLPTVGRKKMVNNRLAENEFMIQVLVDYHSSMSMEARETGIVQPLCGVI